MVFAFIVEGVEREACIERHLLAEFLHDVARQYVLEIVSSDVHVAEIVQTQGQRGILAVGIE
ncbi:hypothetical protein [Prevotella melaninogenica]|uniref:hypothetical protein n=1 Tax=Prevotella melaninogenica TaxID=28132 RepID=UPI0021516B99|nr:hypothetical protein [Prevotella melaninogenica]